MYQTILVPLDGSRRAEAILPHVENLAKHYEAKVIFLKVVEPESLVVPPEPIHAEVDLASYQKRFKEAEQYLAVWRDKLAKRDVDVQIRVTQGPVVSEIIKVAEQEAADLIAMSSHGRTGLARAFYGSVAAGVLHQIDRPLLLIRSLGKK